MRDYDEFIKEAKTRVRKMVDGGQIKDKRLIDKLYFDKPEIKDNIHNRINAKAKRAISAVKEKASGDVARAALSDVTTKPMTAKRYSAYSVPDNLGSKPVIDTGRVLKRGGHTNAKVIGFARKHLGKRRVNVTYNHVGKAKLSPDETIMRDIDNATTRTKWNNRHGGVYYAKIELPSKKSTTQGGRQIPPGLAREHRGISAYHEISGELYGNLRRSAALKDHGLPISQASVGFGNMEGHGHTSPFVLKREHKFVKKLSPAAQRNVTRMRFRSGDNLRMNELMLGPNASKSDLAKPYGDNLKKHWNAHTVLARNVQDQSAGYNMMSPKVHNLIASLSRKQ